MIGCGRERRKEQGNGQSGKRKNRLELVGPSIQISHKEKEIEKEGQCLFTKLILV